MRWLRHTDEVCYGQQFYEANPACKKALLAQARQISLRGAVGKQPQNGHWLEGTYAELYQLKPGDYRFFGFRHLVDFFITSGAAKDPKNQERDYAFALKLKQAFFAEIEKQQTPKQRR